jgi:hypothetical protein
MNEALLDLRCPACDYSLRGIESARCPECGTPVDREALSVPQIPWTHRKVIGVTRAYWRTVRLVTLHPRRLAGDVARPVSYADARRFQQITVLVAYVPLLVIAMGVILNNSPDNFGAFPQHFSERPLGWTLELALLPLAGLCLWLFLFAATGAASYFFHPRSIPIERQNRALALSYYACAPLAVMPLIGFSVLYFYLNSRSITMGNGSLALPVIVESFTVLLALAMLFSLWRVPISLLRRATGCSALRVVALAIYLPIAWLLLAGIILAAIPAAYLFVSIVVLSLH